MSGSVDIREAAAAAHAVRAPLAGALATARKALVDQGMAPDLAMAWASSELLAVVASVLDAELPRAADGDPLDQGNPFDASDTSRHAHMERHIADAAARLTSGGIDEVTATTLAAMQALESLAGILAGTARPRHGSQRMTGDTGSA